MILFVIQIAQVISFRMIGNFIQYRLTEKVIQSIEVEDFFFRYDFVCSFARAIVASLYKLIYTLNDLLLNYFRLFMEHDSWLMNHDQLWLSNNYPLIKKDHFICDILGWKSGVKTVTKFISWKYFSILPSEIQLSSPAATRERSNSFSLSESPTRWIIL